MPVLQPASGSTAYRWYKRLLGQVYRGDPHYKDIMTPTLRQILAGRAAICGTSQVWPSFVIRDGQPIAAAVLAKVDRLPDYLQLAFFEALPDEPEAVDLLLEHAQTRARDSGCTKLLVGLNFHVNYGLGLQADAYDEPGSFGSAHNPAGYNDYFAGRSDRTIRLVSFRRDISAFDFPVSKALMERALRDYSVRPADFSRLEAEARLYTEINNRSFAQHPYYYRRRLEEDLELFRSFRLFMREENLLFLYYKHEPVGFMLWYPDFNQLMRPGETIGLPALLRYRLQPSRIDTFKVVEVGVVPEHQGRFGVMALMRHALERCQGRFRWCESGWIMEGNRGSLGFGERWTDSEHHHFSVYEIDVRTGV